jgi:hypothetical protein
MLVRAPTLSFAHETAGAARTRHSLRPPVFEGEPYARLGRVAPRDRKVMSFVKRNAFYEDLLGRKTMKFPRLLIALSSQ